MRNAARRTLSVLRFGLWLWLVRVRQALTDTSRAEWAEAELSRLRTHAQRLENRVQALEEQGERHSHAIYALLQRIVKVEGEPPESL